jgi:hypothetical protein
MFIPTTSGRIVNNSISNTYNLTVNGGDSGGVITDFGRLQSIGGAY